MCLSKALGHLNFIDCSEVLDNISADLRHLL